MSKKLILTIIILAILLLSAGYAVTSCDSKLRTEIKALETKNDELEKSSKEKDLLIKQQEKKENELNTSIEKKDNENQKLIAETKEIRASRKWWADKFRELQKELEEMSQNDRDKYLIKILKEHNIMVEEIRENTIVITLENRNQMLKLVIDYNKKTGEIENYKTEIINLNDRISNRDQTISDKDELIKTKDDKYIILESKLTTEELQKANLKDMISKLKKRLLLTKVGGFFKKTLPALVVGFIIGKYILEK